ncbi:MAG: hypothetical protein J6U69_00720 [Alistipes sp.]|nr:hypothetical protein [Alistipes sp.]
METHLTDYIPAQVLRQEGFVHISDSAAMLDALDKQYMASKGWINVASAKRVRVSIRKAAEIVGCSAATLDGYVKLGYIAVDSDKKLSLLDVLSFNMSEVKKAYLESKKNGKR